MAATLSPTYRVRALDLGEVLDEAFRIYRARFGLLFGVALVASLPSIVMGLGGGLQTLLYMALQGVVGTAIPVRQGGVDTSLWPVVVAGLALGVMMLPISIGMPHFAASAAALGLPATPGTITRDALRNYFRLWVLGLAHLAMAYFAVFILPVYLLVNWSFTYQALYLEHGGVRRSFARSTALVRNDWWRVFGVRLLAAVIAAGLGWVVGILVGVVALVLPAGLGRQVLEGLFAALAAAVLLPFPPMVATLLYLDERVRKESLDLQLMAGQAAHTAAAPPSPPPQPSPAWSDFPPPPSA